MADGVFLLGFLSGLSSAIIGRRLDAALRRWVNDRVRVLSDQRAALIDAEYKQRMASTKSARYVTKPTDPVHCPACRWQGTIADTNTPEDSIVHCPACGGFAREGHLPADAPAVVPTKGD